MVNNRGQQMTLGTIIAIVLGIAVLVFLIFGFSTGWNNMWSKITELGGGSANVDDVVRGCEVACASQSKDAYCDKSRTVRFEGARMSWNGTGVSNVTSTLGTCRNMTSSTNYPNVNVKPCPGLC